MGYSFLVDTYRTERLKVLSVWSMFRDEDLNFRPHPEDRRGRSFLEHMIHQCLSEDTWFKEMFGIKVGTQVLPKRETRLEFLHHYDRDSAKRADILSTMSPGWWEEKVSFFETKRSRAWIMVRRIAHTAHHRGQQTALLRMLNRDLYSTYGPTADTGGLPKNSAKTIYSYPDESALLTCEELGNAKTPLPGPGKAPPTERP